MKYVYFLGYPHHRIHHQFYYSVLGGQICDSFVQLRSEEFDEEILKLDGKDTVWFFSNWFPFIHKRLVGKQIFIEHGLSFKPSLNPERVDCLNRYFDLIFSSGVSQRNRMIKEGVSPEKIREIGYTTLFQLPSAEVVPNQILLSVSYYGTWNEYDNLLEIMKRMPDSLNAYVTMHPSLPHNKKAECLEIIHEKENLTYVETQEDLLAVTASSRCIIGSSSSVCTPFWYLGKPVIFIRGRQTRIPFYGWQKVRNAMADPLFNEILSESTKISSWQQFSPKLIENAKIPSSRKKIFYESNWNKNVTIEKIKTALDAIADEPLSVKREVAF